MKWLFIMSRLALILMASVLICQATPYYVATSGNDTTGDGSIGNPWKTISNGVAKATTAGDVVNVSTGIYVLATNITILNSITLRGLDRTNTIIQGQYFTLGITNRGLYISNAGATVEEFTVTGFGMPTNTANNAGCGGGAFISNGTLRACIISNNVGSTGGGGVYLAAGMLSNCVISFNSCQTYTTRGGGGGLYAVAGQVWDCLVVNNQSIGNRAYTDALAGGAFLSVVTMVNSVVSNNISGGNGGGIYANASIISNCMINNNTSSFMGGGMCCSNGTVIHGAFIRNNKSSSNHGGISSADGSQFIRNSEISGNTGGSRGGGIGVAVGGSLFMTNCVISNNMVLGGMGGGIDAGQQAHQGMTAVWCRIVNNIASNADGAGVYCWSNCVLDHCSIQGNVITNGSGRSGAGILLKAGGNGMIRNCLIAGNSTPDTTSSRGGGIFVAAGATNQITACTIAGNYAYANGGGVFLTGDGGDTFTNCIIASNSLNTSAADNNIYMTTPARSNAFYYSCSELLANTAQGNITNGPVFENAALSDWRLRRGSAGIDTGINEGWMATDKDLNGRTRIDRFSRRVDMGAYEYLPAGTMFSGR